MRFLILILIYITDENKNGAHQIEEKYNNQNFKKTWDGEIHSGWSIKFQASNRASITINGNTALLCIFVSESRIITAAQLGQNILNSNYNF